jgi:hypothetical protein
MAPLAPQWIEVVGEARQEFGQLFSTALNHERAKPGKTRFRDFALSLFRDSLG